MWRVVGGDIGEISRVILGRALLVKVRSLFFVYCGFFGKLLKGFELGYDVI